MSGPAGRVGYFVTHPNVVVSADVPVPRWPLSALGRDRMRAGLGLPWLAEVSAIYCSTERKAVDGAEIWAEALGLSPVQVPELGENDRSATGFLPPPEFERVADAFFASPERSVRGWERACDAQARIVSAVSRLMRADASAGAVVVVSHGAVGTLLWCHLRGESISRRWDQPANGGGNYFQFTLDPPSAAQGWRPIDAP